MLTERRPDIAMMAAGGASMDVGRPILMPTEALLEFVRLAAGRWVDWMGGCAAAGHVALARSAGARRL